MNIQLVESQTHMSNPRNRPVSMEPKSRYIPNSIIPEKNPEVLHSFFHDNAMERFSQDITKLKPVSYESPEQVRLANRPFIVVEEKVKYGQPLSPEQFEALLKKKSEKPQIVTYGLGEERKKEKKSSAPPPREKVDIKVESGKNTVCCCCGDDPKGKNALVENYE